MLTLPLDQQGAGPCFVVGVTGHMNILPWQIDSLRAQLRVIFRFIRRGPGFCDGADGKVTALEDLLSRVRAPSNALYELMKRWPQPQKLPVILLSSLSPGADTIAARVGIEEGLRVVGVLPFPHGIYDQSSTFHWVGPDGCPLGGTEERISTYRQIVDEIGVSSTFPVLLPGDIELPPEDRIEVFHHDLCDREARRRRYRAAGEYIALHAHMMIAVWDGGDQQSNEGTAAIVQASLTGQKTVGGTTTVCSRADACPVVHVHVDVGGEPVELHNARNMRFLVPEISLSEQDRLNELYACGIPQVTRDWRLRGMAVLMGIAKNIRDFQAEIVAARAGLATELDYRKLDPGAAGFGSDVKRAAPGFHQALSRMAGLRLQAATASRKLHQRTRMAIRNILVLAFFAVAFFHVFAHWHDVGGKNTHAGEGEAIVHVDSSEQVGVTNAIQSEGGFVIVRPLLGGLGIASAILGLVYFGLRRCEQNEERAQDYRALAEGLRVQFYWGMAGVDESVVANYVLRQGNELGWIRDAIRCVSAPNWRWRDWFSDLTRAMRIRTLDSVFWGWVDEQCDWFVCRARDLGDALHFWNRLSHTLGLAGLWTAGLAVCVCKGAAARDLLVHESGLVLGLATAPVVLAAIVGAYRRRCADRSTTVIPSDPESLLACLVPTSHPHDVPTASYRSLAHLITMNFMLCLPFSIALSAWTAYGSACVSGILEAVPPFEDLLVIWAGMFLVAGALGVAWAEKNLYSELSRQYHAMGGIFSDARVNIRASLNKLRKADADGVSDAEFDRLAAVTQSMMVTLGLEALDENAQWLILHRSRPLEPIVPG